MYRESRALRLRYHRSDGLENIASSINVRISLHHVNNSARKGNHPLYIFAIIEVRFVSHQLSYLYFKSIRTKTIAF